MIDLNYQLQLKHHVLYLPPQTRVHLLDDDAKTLVIFDYSWEHLRIHPQK